MTSLSDLILEMPLPELALRGLLFFSFFLHFVFVLLTLGTGMLGAYYYLRGHFAGSQRFAGWDHDFLKRLFVYKSLAIVLGVGPILLMQTGYSIPFLGGVNFVAPLWLLLATLLITALLLLEAVAERPPERRRWYVPSAVVGLACLLAVPAIFAAALVATENPHAWPAMIAAGGRLPRDLSTHWALRYGHVLGAAVVFTAALHYLHAKPAERRRRRVLLAWIFGALAVQLALGVALYASLPRPPQPMIDGLILLGVVLALVVMGLVFRGRGHRRSLRPIPLASLLLVLLLAMLLTRQLLQNQVLLPVSRQLDRVAQERREVLDDFRGEAWARFQAIQQSAYNNPTTIYFRSCDFCHGAVANGQGDEAFLLEIPPEDLTALRITPDELKRVLREGVPGTAMPRFRYYTAEEIQHLIAFLGTTGLRHAPEPVQVPVSSQALSRAFQEYSTTCVVCHGPDGRGTALSATFAPPPPDLTVNTVSADRAFTIITHGYPGTLMPSFATLDEDVRWGLVHVVHRLFGPDSNRLTSDP